MALSCRIGRFAPEIPEARIRGYGVQIELACTIGDLMRSRQGCRSTMDEQVVATSVRKLLLRIIMPWDEPVLKTPCRSLVALQVQMHRHPRYVDGKPRM